MLRSIALIPLLLGVMTFLAPETGNSVYADEEAPPVESASIADSGEEEVVEEEAEDTLALLRDDVNVLWTCLAAFLVFFMQAGFALVETGFTRGKNACNIIMKNLMDLSLGSVLFWVLGFGLMFGPTGNGWIGSIGGEGSDFMFNAEVSAAEQGSSEAFGWAFLIFQTVFCATAATIVSGAVAERTKFTGYLVYSVVICAIIYPVFGSWAWGSLWRGEGWLEGKGFYDFAGSTVVHSVGGWAALAGAIVIGPRLGKYNSNGQITPIPGHNIPLGALGVFILWLGWFGFNPGSTTAVGGEHGMAYIAVNTNLAAAGGAITAMLSTWILYKKPDPSLALNGALAGLVSITAGCDALTPMWSLVAGLIGGVIVVASVVALDKVKIDDPVGAVSVHGVCGAWGTLAVGLFSDAATVGQQLTGIIAGFAWAFPTSLILFLGIKYTIGLRVSEEEEFKGLDVMEHGVSAYGVEAA